MATLGKTPHVPDPIVSQIADGAITKYRFVTQHSDPGEVDQAGANEPVCGVAYNTAADGEAIDVATGPYVLVDCGGVITCGAAVKSDANGKAVAAATTGTTMQEVAGYAAITGADGIRIAIRLLPHKHRPAVA